VRVPVLKGEDRMKLATLEGFEPSFSTLKGCLGEAQKGTFEAATVAIEVLDAKGVTGLRPAIEIGVSCQKHGA